MISGLDAHPGYYQDGVHHQHPQAVGGRQEDFARMQQSPVKADPHAGHAYPYPHYGQPVLPEAQAYFNHSQGQWVHGHQVDRPHPDLGYEGHAHHHLHSQHHSQYTYSPL
jgi:hypothetical protein